MPKPPRLPPKEITERIKQQLAQYDRNPFQDALADALTVSPSKTAWRRLATKDPAKWAQAVTTMARPAGFSERSESLSITLNAADMARELVARHGPDQAKVLLTAAGLPESLVRADIPAEAPEPAVIDQNPAQALTDSDTDHYLS